MHTVLDPVSEDSPSLPHICLRLPDGTLATMVPGDIIGRLSTAAACIPRPQISEAHAMLSLRGRQLKLLALRGQFSLAHKPLSTVVLKAGMVLILAEGLQVTVESMVLPSEVMAIEGDSLPRQILGGVVSLVMQPRPRLHKGARDNADALIWSTGSQWWIHRDGEDHTLNAGDTFIIHSHTFNAVAVPLRRPDIETETETFVVKDDRLPAAQIVLHIEARSERVEIKLHKRLVLRLVAAQAQLVCFLLTQEQPVAWSVAAKWLWPQITELPALRQQWDTCMQRIQIRLRSANIREDLIQLTGEGDAAQVALVLQLDEQASGPA